jgi:transcriptional regulator with XRE-family HTH domain
MANTNLKNARQSAGLTAEEFANIIKVDPKSVQRWVDGPTRPYPRNRAAIARALNLTGYALWPDETQPPATHAGAGSEATGTWGQADSDNAPDPVEFISSNDGTIDIIDTAGGIELTARLLAALIGEASIGRHVRVATSRPRRRLKQLIGRDHIEVRIIDAGLAHSIVRAGDTMLLTFSVSDEPDLPPPLLQLSRQTDSGLFDRLADNFIPLWDDTDDDTLTNPTQLDPYLTNSDQDDEDAEAYSSGPAEPGTPPPLESSETPRPTGTLANAEPQQTPRRWPRQPG